MNIGVRRGLWRWLVSACLCLPLSVSAATQQRDTLPPPPAERPADPNAFDTQQLVNAAHQLNANDLPAVRMRAEEGDARSQVLLGLAYEMGSAGLMAHSAEALSWFLKAAAQGNTWAQMWSADFYFTGSPGVEQDFAKALPLYKSAAEGGEPRAAYFVGQMYFYGDGVPVNQREAASWYRRAQTANPAVIDPLLELTEPPCDTAFCVGLRQVMGAIVTETATRFIDGWDEAKREWDANLTLPDSDRCGLTSSDRSSAGDVQNFFCDSAEIADEARGLATARQIADRVQAALPNGFTRTERGDARPGPTTYFARDGHAHIRVSYNVTPGSAQHRVTVVVGP